MKKLNVIVKEKSLLELAEDGKKGDLIDLEELTQVDSSYLETLIASGKDKVYEDKISEFKKRLDAENLVKINELNNKISSLEKQHESELKINAQNIEKEYLNKVIVLCGILVFPVAMFLIYVMAPNSYCYTLMAYSVVFFLKFFLSHFKIVDFSLMRILLHR